MKKDPILHVIDYFSFFSYPPTVKEIHTFLSVKMSRRDLEKNLEILVNKKVLEAQGQSSIRYVRKGMFKYFDLYTNRSAVSSRKIKRVAKYLSLLNRLPFLLLTGISGSVAMKNAKETDDIDIFIITIPNRLWTTRFWAVTLAYILGIKRNRGDKNVSDKICLNLFFDGKNIKIPVQKQNEYVAHEILQLQPLLNRDGIYEYFLMENQWIQSFFPNVKIGRKVTNVEIYNNTFLGTFFEKIAKALQLFFIKRHQTKELISDTQLWFYPKDFENHLKKHIPIRKIS